MDSLLSSMLGRVAAAARRALAYAPEDGYRGDHFTKAGADAGTNTAPEAPGAAPTLTMSLADLEPPHIAAMVVSAAEGTIESTDRNNLPSVKSALVLEFVGRAPGQQDTATFRVSIPMIHVGEMVDTLDRRYRHYLAAHFAPEEWQGEEGHSHE